MGRLRSLVKAAIDHELVVVDDHSSDGTATLLADLQQEIPRARLVNEGLIEQYFAR